MSLSTIQPTRLRRIRAGMWRPAMALVGAALLGAAAWLVVHLLRFDHDFRIIVAFLTGVAGATVFGIRLIASAWKGESEWLESFPNDFELVEPLNKINAPSQPVRVGRSELLDVHDPSDVGQVR